MATRKFLISDLENISFELVHTNPGRPIGLEIWLDQQCLFESSKLTKNLEFAHEFSCDHRPHQLKLVVKNKIPLHTVLDHRGQIIQDTALIVQNFRMNDVLMIDSFCTKSQYTCKELGKRSLIESFGYLGFNGQVIFDFESPLDQWALEHYV